jgi:hypothetical protein
MADEMELKPDHARRRVIMASVKLGSWLSSALDDPNVCEEMKADIREWFSAGEPVVGWASNISTQSQRITELEDALRVWAYKAQDLDDALDLIDDPDRRDFVTIIFGGMNLGELSIEHFRRASSVLSKGED